VLTEIAVVVVRKVEVDDVVVLVVEEAVDVMLWVVVTT
jgi:hypothetical protein